MSDHRLLAYVQSPVESARVVRDTQNDWMRVIVDFSRCKQDKGCTVIHDDCHIFETVDQNKQLVQLVLEVQVLILRFASSMYVMRYILLVKCSILAKAQVEAQD